MDQFQYKNVIKAIKKTVRIYTHLDPYDQTSCYEPSFSHITNSSGKHYTQHSTTKWSTRENQKFIMVKGAQKSFFFKKTYNFWSIFAQMQEYLWP